MVEEKFDVGHLLELIEEALVEAAAVYGGDVPAVDVVGLCGLGGRAGGGEAVDHAAVHGDCFCDDAVEELRVLGMAEGVDTAF